MWKSCSMHNSGRNSKSKCGNINVKYAKVQHIRIRGSDCVRFLWVCVLLLNVLIQTWLTEFCVLPLTGDRESYYECVHCPTAYHFSSSKPSVGNQWCLAAGSELIAGRYIVCPQHFQPLKSNTHHSRIHTTWCCICDGGKNTMKFWVFLFTSRCLVRIVCLVHSWKAAF
jgi:hypothetical protein